MAAKKITIQPIRTWIEKSKDGAFPDGAMRIYAGGNIHLGWAVPVRDAEREEYTYQSRKLEEIINVPEGVQTLEEIIMHIELSLKEFCTKVVKSFE